jgi:multiple sugar transport system permease protein
MTRNPMQCSWYRRRFGAGFWFAMPALSLIALFFVVPVMAALALSFTDFDLYVLGDFSTLRFVGPGNYLRILHDPLFWLALQNTLYFVLIGGSLSVVFSLAVALLVNHGVVRLMGLFRTLLFLPVVTTLVAVAVVWRYLYHQRYGALNWLLEQFGIGPIDWLGDAHWAMPAIILMAIWKNFGFNMIIFIAGLQSIPERLYEAARLDGAGSWAQFRYITLPLLFPTFLFVSVITMIGCFQLFAEPYLMTQGGPSNHTLSLGLLMFNEGFRWWNMGYASALAFVLFSIILLVALIQARLGRERNPS